jgi:hypothetical protein
MSELGFVGFEDDGFNVQMSELGFVKFQDYKILVN